MIKFRIKYSNLNHDYELVTSRFHWNSGTKNTLYSIIAKEICLNVYLANNV